MSATRSTKLYGGKIYQAGKILDDTEIEGDFAALFSKFDGNIVDADVNTSAGIQARKVDHESEDSEFFVTAPSGDSANKGSASDLRSELWFLRYGLLRAGMGVKSAAYYDDADAPAAGYWNEPPPVGGNLLRGSSFEILDTTTVAVGWTAVATATLGVTQTDSELGQGLELNVAANANNDGIQQVVKGLKSDTKYVIGVWAKGSGTLRTVTTGALGAGTDYQNIDHEAALTAAYDRHAFIVQTDNSGTDITLQFLRTTIGTMDLDHAFMYELGANPAHESPRTALTRTISAPDAAFSGGSGTVAVSGLSITLSPPAQNYMMRATVQVSWEPANANTTAIVVLLLRDGAVIRHLPSQSGPGTNNFGNSVTLTHIDDELDAGTAYVYSVSIECDTDAARDAILAPDLTTQHATNGQQECSLTVEMIPTS